MKLSMKLANSIWVVSSNVFRFGLTFFGTLSGILLVAMSNGVAKMPEDPRGSFQEAMRACSRNLSNYSTEGERLLFKLPSNGEGDQNRGHEIFAELESENRIRFKVCEVVDGTIPGTVGEGSHSCQYLNSKGYTLSELEALAAESYSNLMTLWMLSGAVAVTSGYVLFVVALPVGPATLATVGTRAVVAPAAEFVGSRIALLLVRQTPVIPFARGIGSAIRRLGHRVYRFSWRVSQISDFVLWGAVPFFVNYLYSSYSGNELKELNPIQAQLSFLPELLCSNSPRQDATPKDITDPNFLNELSNLLKQ